MTSPDTTTASPEEQPMSTVTVTAGELRALLSAVIPFASRDDCLPTLCALRIEAGAGVITATATDRYGLGHARRKAAGELAPVLLPVVRAERLAAEMKGRGDQPVEIGVAPSHLGDAITVHLDDVDWRIKQAAGDYPDLTPILDPAGYEKIGVEGVVRFAPALLARVHEAVSKLDYEPARLYFRGDDKPLRAEVGGWFAALLMPMRLRQIDDHDGPTPIVPYALPTAPATLPEPGPPPTVDDVTYPKTPEEATAGRMARVMAAACYEATHRSFDEPWPKLPPADQRTDEQRRQARAHMDLMGAAVHTHGLAHLLRAFAEVSPAAADRAAREMWMDWDAGDSIGERAYEWLCKDGVDPLKPLPEQGWPRSLRAAEELIKGE